MKNGKKRAETKTKKNVLLFLIVVVVGFVLFFVVFKGQKTITIPESAQEEDIDLVPWVEQGGALLVKDVYYLEEEGVVYLVLENTNPEPTYIGSFARFPTPDTPNEYADGWWVDYTLEPGESREFMVPVDSKPYKLRIMAPHQPVLDIILPE